ncbi:MAG: hypothetical protein HC836_44855 [Richelia sp. RM2_1_2]|nr:hypothetical protein [Richelia sp. RM2_1_2]
MKEATLLEQAVVDIKQIKEAAEKAAMDKLSKAMPKEFDKFLKEELSKKERIKESTIVDKKKESQKVNESFLDTPQESSVEEGWATEELTSAQPTDVAPDAEVTNDCGCDDKNGEVLDMTGLTIDDIEQAYNDASSDDEIEVVKDSGASDAEVEGDELDQDAVMNDIEAELQQIGAEDEVETGIDDTSVEEGNAEQVSDPFEIMKKVHGELTQAISAIEEKLNVEGYSKEFETKMSEIYGEGCKEAIGEQKYNEMFDIYKTRKMDEMHKGNLGKETIAKAHNGDLGKQTVAETEEVVKEETASTPEGSETEIEENKISTLANKKQVSGSNAPSPEYDQHNKKKLRSALQTESENKKLTSLLDENKKLTKKINESKKSVNDLTTVLKEYQGALTKYRKQLSEMAVFNNNLAHVNNILVNESLALTSKEKKRIIERFKGVSTLEESEKTYKAVLSEMTEEKKNIVESIENKVSNVVEPSSANRLGTVVENTAFVNEHVNKIKELISYVEKRK